MLTVSFCNSDEAILINLWHLGRAEIGMAKRILTLISPKQMYSRRRLMGSRLMSSSHHSVHVIEVIQSRPPSVADSRGSQGVS